MRADGKRGGVRRLIAPSVALLVACAVLTACGGSSANDGSDGTASAGNANTPVIRLVFTRTEAALPVWVADSKGLFKKNGVDVQLNRTSDLSSIIPALGHQFDLGMGVQPVLIQAASKGIGVVQVSGNKIVTKDNPTHFVVSRPDSGILKPEDLLGKTVGAPTLTGNINFATQYWLKQKGIDPSKVQFRQVDTPQMPDQLKAGRLDAAEIAEPYAQILLNQGYHEVGYMLEAVGEPVYMSSWIASGSWAKAHKKEIAAFRKALDEADAWIKGNKDAAATILAKNTGQPLDMVKEAPLSDFSTENSPETLSQWDPVLRSVGNFNGHVDYDQLVVNP